MTSSWSLIAAKDLPAELRLAQAVSEFQTCLSPKEKIEFQNRKAQYTKDPPAVQDVCKLTAQIDHACNRWSNGRVFGPRFMNMLQAVQRFASIGDVLIGGSQNVIACGVWTGVRFTLLVSLFFASWLDFTNLTMQTATSSFHLMNSISELFMQVGRQAPRYEELAYLYPESKSLQNSLLEYFIVVVRLCHHIVKYTQKTKLSHFMSSFGESEIERFRHELEMRGCSIRDEVTTLTLSLVKAEASRGEKFRARYLGESHIAVLKREAKLKAKVLERCSQYKHEELWKHLRKAGTAKMFLEMETYRDWKLSPASSTILFTGKIGCGKIVLLANVVDDLNLNPVHQKTLITYFFCQWDNNESLKARTILGSLAFQVLKVFYAGTNNDPSWQDIANDTDQMALETLAAIIGKAVPQDWTIVFVLDGIDDCTKQETEELCSQLSNLQASIRLHICISTGLEQNSDFVHNSSLRKKQTIMIPEQNPDIEAFIDAELARRIESRELVLGDGTLVLEIRNALLQGAQGMMLWVALQIDAICTEKSDAEIRIALQALPSTLTEVFAREMRRHHSERNPTYLDRALVLLLGSIRPLKEEEFGEAISVETGNSDWQPTRQVNDIRSVLSGFGKLVFIEEESLSVRISHHSIKKFLLATHFPARDGETDDFDAQLAMTGILITYLSYGAFDRQLSTRVIPSLPTRQIAPAVLASTIKSKTAADLALKLLHGRHTKDFDLRLTVSKMIDNSTSNTQETFPFRDYAERHFLDHIWTYMVSDDTKMVKRGLTVIRQSYSSIYQIISDIFKRFESHGSVCTGSANFAASWTAPLGSAVLFSMTHFQSPSPVRIPWDLCDVNGLSCMDWAIKTEHSKILKSLLIRGNGDPRVDLTVHPLLFALKHSCFKSAAILMDCFSTNDSGVRERELSNVLVCLVLEGQTSGVSWLMEHGLDACAFHYSYDPETDLSLPSLSSKFLSIQDPSTKSGLLYFALLSGSREMVLTCIERGAPLSALYQKYHESDLQRILDVLRINQLIVHHRLVSLVHPNFFMADAWNETFRQSQVRAMRRCTSGSPNMLKYRKGHIISNISWSKEDSYRGQIGSSRSRRTGFVLEDVEPIVKVRAMCDYSAIKQGELSFKKHEIITIVEAIYPGWWKGSLGKEVGAFPVDYVEVIYLGGKFLPAFSQ